MVASEFKIGVWVNVYGKDIILDEDYLEVIFGARNYEDYKPIIITEEWLLKFGINEACWEGLLLIDTGWSIIIEKSENGYYSVQVNGEYQISEIMYVHQLQNLYVALTGKELLVK